MTIKLRNIKELVEAPSKQRIQDGSVELSDVEPLKRRVINSK